MTESKPRQKANSGGKTKILNSQYKGKKINTKYVPVEQKKDEQNANAIEKFNKVGKPAGCKKKLNDFHKEYLLKFIELQHNVKNTFKFFKGITNPLTDKPWTNSSIYNFHYEIMDIEEGKVFLSEQYKKRLSIYYDSKNSIVEEIKSKIDNGFFKGVAAIQAYQLLVKLAGWDTPQENNTQVNVQINNQQPIQIIYVKPDSPETTT